jgi:hypothetical protein
MEYKSLTNVEYLANSVYRYKYNVMSLYEIYEYIGKHFILGYEIFKDGDHEGVAFAMCYNGVYTMDGYNDGHSFFAAVNGGRRVCKDLFDGYTDVVYTGHRVSERVVTLVTKRIGFKEVETKEGIIVLRLEKSWV